MALTLQEILSPHDVRVAIDAVIRKLDCRAGGAAIRYEKFDYSFPVPDVIVSQTKETPVKKPET